MYPRVKRVRRGDQLHEYVHLVASSDSLDSWIYDWHNDSAWSRWTTSTLFVSLAQHVRLSGQSRSNRTVQPQALLPVHTGGMTDHSAENGASRRWRSHSSPGG